VSAKSKRQRTNKPGHAYGSGSLEFCSGHYWNRVILPDGSYPRYRLCRDGQCDCLSLSLSMRRERADAIAERERARVDKELAEDKAGGRSLRITVQQFGELWTSGKLYERHGEVKGLRVKRSAKSDETRLKAHVYPFIGTCCRAPEYASFR
jgi:hypothetical protein